jgi:hypothetical protein
MTDDPESTFSLVERAHRGDEGALERLMNRHLTPLAAVGPRQAPHWARDAEETPTTCS